MRCFACDRPLQNPYLDPPTKRWYCQECFEPTTEEQLRLAGKDYRPYEGEVETLDPETESLWSQQEEIQDKDSYYDFETES